MLIRRIIASHLCTAASCQQFRKKIEKTSNENYILTYYSFFHYRLLSCRYVMFQKRILSKPKSGAQAVVRGGTAPLAPRSDDTAVLAYLWYAKLIGFRNMAICGSFCSLLSCSGILLAIGYPFLFSVKLAASLLQGVTHCICYSPATFFSVSRFPDRVVFRGDMVPWVSGVARNGGTRGGILWCHPFWSKNR